MEKYFAYFATDKKFPPEISVRGVPEAKGMSCLYKFVQKPELWTSVGIPQVISAEPLAGSLYRVELSDPIPKGHVLVPTFIVRRNGDFADNVIGVKGFMHMPLTTFEAESTLPKTVIANLRSTVGS